MSEDQPIQNDARRTARRKKLGPDAVCILCGQPQLETLVPVARSLLEAHHVLGKEHNGKVTVPLCRNCHAIVTEKLQQVGASMERADALPDRIVAMLRALGAFLLLLGEAVLNLALELSQYIRAHSQRPGANPEVV